MPEMRLFRRRRGPTSWEVGVAVATTWDEFEPEVPDRPDEDDALNLSKYRHLVSPAELAAHRAEDAEP